LGIGVTGGSWNSDSLNHLTRQWSDEVRTQIELHNNSQPTTLNLNTRCLVILNKLNPVKKVPPKKYATTVIPQRKVTKFEI
jgi:hypothetical protein